MPSSLPPSSPPSASSGPFVDGVAHQPMSPSVAGFNEPGLVIAAEASDANSHADLDPFGFFALENKLKIFRSHQQEVEPRYQTAQIQTVHATPPIPSKRRNERKAIKSPIPFVEGGSELDSGSPSFKPISRKGKERAVAVDKPIPKAELDNDTSETLASSPKTKPRQRNSKESGNPSERYPLRQTGAAAKSRKYVSRGRTRDEGRCVNVAEAVMKTVQQRPRVKRTAKPTNDANTDVKRWEQERQARLDYFKKLDDYQLEKENVYVV